MMTWPGGGYPVTEHGSDKHEQTVWIPQAYNPRVGDWISPPEIVSSYGTISESADVLFVHLILLQRRMRFDLSLIHI